MPVLTFVDTLGIQSYVFASNRLRDVVGGSDIVSRMTDPNGWIRQNGFQNSVVVGDGGNLLLRFESLEQSKAFATQYSRMLLDEAPELEIALVHHEYSKEQLSTAILEIQAKMEKKKFERCPSVPLLGLGVTATCRETQRPAITVDLEGRPIGKAVAARRKTGHHQRRWNKFLPRDARNFQCNNGETVELAFPLELDDLGRSEGDTSLMGVVHIDGNSVGQKLKEWLNDQIDNGDEAICKEYQEISTALRQLTENVFKGILKRTIASIRWCKRQKRYIIYSSDIQKGFPLQWTQRQGAELRQMYLPIRPILLGGDDLTFVCDGRIALDLATHALTEFEEAPPLSPIGTVRSCAGVALVKTHAPFARAYNLADSLCQSAKRWLRDNQKEGLSAIDWHIGLISPTEPLARLRERQYNVLRGRKGGLTLRPYLLDQQDHQEPFIPNWRWLAESVLGTKNNGLRTDSPKTANWQSHRSKLKALRESVREGRESVREALEAWQVAHPYLRLPVQIEDGYIEACTPMLDALELMDIHYPLGQTGDNTDE